MRSKNKRLFYIAKQLHIFFALALATTVLVRPLQHTLMERMTELRDYLITASEDYLGFEIEYASMGPSLFGSLDIRKIKVYGGEAGVYTRSSPFITLSRIRLSYSLPDLLKGDFADAIRGIKLDKPVIALDSRSTRDIQALAAKFKGDGSRPLKLPRAITVRVRRGECSIRQGENHFSLGGLNFDAQIKGDEISLHGRWGANISLALPEKPFTVGMAGRLSGNYDTSVRKGNVILNIPSTQGEDFSIRAVNFNIALDEDGLLITKILDRTPYELSLNYSFDSRRFAGTFRADNFSPRELMVLSGSRKEFNQYLSLSITGDVGFEAGGEGGLSYTANLSGNMGQSFPLGRMGYTVIGRGNENSIHVNQLALRFAQGDFRYTGELGLKPLSPNGTISISGFSLTGDGTASAELAVSSNGRRTNLFSENAAVGEVVLSALDAEIIQEEGGITFDVSALRFGDIESWEDVRLSRLSLNGYLDSSPRELQASLILDAFSVLDAADMLRPFVALPVFPGSISAAVEDIAVTTEIFFNSDFTQILYTAPNSVVLYQGKREIVALVSVSGTDKRLDLDSGRLIWAGRQTTNVLFNRIDLSGFVDFSNLDDIFFSIRSSYLDLAYSLEGMVQNRRSLSITGSYGLSASAAKLNRGGYFAYIETGEVPIPINGKFARLSLLADIQYNSPEFWSASLARLELKDFATPGSPSTALRLSGNADAAGARFREFVYDDGKDPLSGQASLNWNIAEREYSAALRLENRRGGEYYNVNGSWRNSTLEAALTGSGMQLNRVGGNFNTALASGEVRLTWKSPEDWTARLNISSLSALRDNTLTLAAQGSLDNKKLTLQDIRISYEGSLQARFPHITVSLPDAQILADARLWGTFAGRTIDMSFSAAAAFTAVNSWSGIPAALEAFTGVLKVDHARLDALEASEPFTVDFSRTASAIALTGGPKNMIRLSLAEAGAFYANLSAPSPIRGTVIGVMDPKNIDAQVSDLYVDMVSLWKFIPHSETINFTGGFINGNIQIRGPLGDPEFFGLAQGHSIRLSVPHFISAEVGPTPVVVILDGNEMHFGPLTTQVEKGRALVSGRFRFDRWIPNTYDLDIRAQPGMPVPVAVAIQGINAHGNASGTLTIANADSILRITGNLTAEDMEITMDTDTEEISSDEQSRASSNITPLLVDISVKTGRKVEFIYPNTKFPILRAYPAMGTGVRITSDTIAARYSVDGDVALKSGEVFYFQRSFYIRDGILSFNENEIQFDPKLTVKAEIRDRNDDGPVTISMIVDNAPLTSFTPRFEANPALSQFEILSLLGQNFSGAATGVGAVFTAVGDVANQVFISRKLEAAGRWLFRADMFSLRTQLILNAVSRIWNPVTTFGTFSNLLDNTSVSLGWYIGTDMFVQGMLSLRYDDFLNPNEGFTTTNRGLQWGQYIFEPDIGIELNSPWFDIRWNVSPRVGQMDVEKMFINTMSFSLTKQWTFR
ncbi:hypothetical protein AGMMS49991_04920 [Spirochaetia bacterium]|nr:hypothetical protein AGMMS49991_04920 [Spirochaetia bacterium]